MADGQPRFFDGFPVRGLPRLLARLDVAARLQPDAEPLVTVQYHSAWSDDDGRAGDVDRIGLLVVRLLETVQFGEELPDGFPFTIIDRPVVGQLRAQSRDA
jgi:hypothetical protein